MRVSQVEPPQVVKLKRPSDGAVKVKNVVFQIVCAEAQPAPAGIASEPVDAVVSKKLLPTPAAGAVAQSCAMAADDTSAAVAVVQMNHQFVFRI